MSSIRSTRCTGISGELDYVGGRCWQEQQLGGPVEDSRWARLTILVRITYDPLPCPLNLHLWLGKKNADVLAAL